MNNSVEKNKNKCKNGNSNSGNGNGNGNLVNLSYTPRECLTLGQKAADRVTNIVGSWKFIIFQSFILLIWMILNVVAWIQHWDPYPFILLNLVLSFQAAFTAPIILMSQNRTAERDRKKAAIDLATDRRAERAIQQVKIQLEKESRRIGEILRVLKDKK